MNADKRRFIRVHPCSSVVLLVALFLLSRVLVFALPPLTSDVGIYANYAREFDAAAREGAPFYELHSQRIDAKTQMAREEGKLVGSLEEYKDVEYPPIALLFMRVPRIWLGSVPVGVDVGIDSGFGARYRTSFMSIMAVVDVGLFGLLIGLVWPRLTAEYAESAEEENAVVPPRSPRTPRLMFYLIATILLWHLLYDRLDLVLALLIVLALWLLSSRLHYFWSFAVLAVAVNFKVVPLVLAPVWVLGSMTVQQVLSLPRPRGLLVLAARSCLLLVLIVGCFLPFYLVSGKPTLGFLTYHQNRGLEIGSVYSSLPLALHALGIPLGVEYSYGSINIHSPLADALARLAPMITAAIFLAATVFYFFNCRRVSCTNHSTAALSTAHHSPLTTHHLLPPYTLLFLMLYILTNKVFSPQYLLWLAPLLALASLEGTTWRRLSWGLLLTCLLSTMLVPFLFVTDLYDNDSLTVPRTFHEPTLRLCVLLLGRNILFCVLITALALALWKRARLPTAKPLKAVP